MWHVPRMIPHAIWIPNEPRIWRDDYKMVIAEKCQGFGFSQSSSVSTTSTCSSSALYVSNLSPRRRQESAIPLTKMNGWDTSFTPFCRQNQDRIEEQTSFDEKSKRTNGIDVNLSTCTSFELPGSRSVLNVSSAI